jgi:hypothetical protein
MTRTIVTAIVSTAAPGAERGALDAAIELGIGWGGWIPEGADYADEVYRAHAHWTTGDRGMAVRLNARDSDGTLVVSFAEQLTGRCKHAADLARQQRKHCQHLILPAGGRTRITDQVRAALLKWIDTHHISVLHVVGPGEEQEPGIQQATHDALVWVFEDQPVVQQPGMPTAMDVVHAVCEHGLSAAGDALMERYPEAKRRYEESLVLTGGAVYRADTRELLEPDAVPESTDSDAPAGTFAGVDRSVAPRSLQHVAEPPDLTPERFAQLAAKVNATGALTAEARARLGASIRQAEIEVRGKETTMTETSHKGHSKQWVSGPLRSTEQILDEDGLLGSFTLCLYWKPAGPDDPRVYWVDFELFEVHGVPHPEGKPAEYQRRDSDHGPDLVRDLDEAEVTAQGFVKWDGCTQFDVTSVHVDSKRQLERLFEAIGEARRRCAAVMSSNYDLRREYPELELE